MNIKRLENIKNLCHSMLSIVSRYVARFSSSFEQFRGCCVRKLEFLEGKSRFFLFQIQYLLKNSPFCRKNQVLAEHNRHH